MTTKTHSQPSPEVSGHTIRFKWQDGATKGETHEHIFHDDGTVEWHSVGEKTGEKQQNGTSDGKGKTERPKYAAVPVADGVYAVSYLADSGYTLTTVLNFHDHKLYGFASNDKMWSPTNGTFEVVK